MWPFRRFAPRAVLAAIFVMLSSGVCLAASSVDIPVGSRVYDDLERLEIKGLLPDAILTTKPFGRLEGARLTREARENLEALSRDKKERLESAYAIIGGLEKEFRSELADDTPPFFIKPVDRLYSGAVYSDKTPYFLNVNNKGDRLPGGSALRAGFTAEARFLDAVSLYLNPEYRLDRDSNRVSLPEGYLKVELYGVELLAGRESMWWGPGSHGDLLITDNAKAFDVVRLSSSHPFVLPWVFGYLGPFKPTVFLTRLEKDRDFPRANLLGMRLDFKPTPGLGIGLSRVFLFGGRGRRSLGASDWFKVFFASDSAEHSKSPINGDQIASVDVSYVYVNSRRLVPFSGVKLYTDWGAEDSSGHTKTPSGRANTYGVFIDEPLWLKDFDFRVEWANTAHSARYGPQWYTHFLYTTGYTYEGRVIGHHMGTDAKDLFLRAQHHLEGGARLGAEFDREWSGVHDRGRTIRRTWYEADVRYPLGRSSTLSGAVGYENTDDPVSGDSRTVETWLKIETYF